MNLFVRSRLQPSHSSFLQRGACKKLDHCRSRCLWRSSPSLAGISPGLLKASRDPSHTRGDTAASGSSGHGATISSRSMEGKLDRSRAVVSVFFRTAVPGDEFWLLIEFMT